VDCIFGIAINEQLGDSIIVTVIATGFDDAPEKAGGKKRRSQHTAAEPQLFTKPTIQTPGNPGVVTSVEDGNAAGQDDQIPNFFFNR